MLSAAESPARFVETPVVWLRGRDASTALSMTSRFFWPSACSSKNFSRTFGPPTRYSSLKVSSFYVLYRSGERIGSVTHWQPSTNESCQFLPTSGLRLGGADDSSAMENSSRSAFFNPNAPAALLAVVSGFAVSAPRGRNQVACLARMRMCCCCPCCC